MAKTSVLNSIATNTAWLLNVYAILKDMQIRGIKLQYYTTEIMQTIHHQLAVM